MLGAIIGDTVGSRFEWKNHKSKDFTLFSGECRLTDDSVMTLAIAKAILASREDRSDLSGLAVRCMQQFGRLYPNAGYGGSFARWLRASDPQPYNSYGNGAAMRISPCGFAARNLDEAKETARLVTVVTHDHPEGIKGAEAVASAVFLARTGRTKEEIRNHMEENYYRLDFTLDEIREEYTFDVSCQGSVPQALEAFLESADFEDAIRSAVSIGGDSDTIAAIAGGIAEAYYGIPDHLREQEMAFMDERQREILTEFEKVYPR